jgi:hypothetical protein
LLLVTNKGLLYLFIVTMQQDALTQYKVYLYVYTQYINISGYF